MTELLHNDSIIVLVFSTPHDNLIVYKCFKRFIEQSMEVKSIEIFSGTQLVKYKNNDRTVVPHVIKIDVENTRTMIEPLYPMS
jgi:hypothetical protein